MTGVTTWLWSTSLVLGLVGAEPAAPSPPPAAPPAPASEPAPEGELEPSTEPPPGSPTATAPLPSSAAVRAQEHFAAEQWDAAIEALMEAYAADPQPAYLYARAQAERMRGNCRAAIALYERFLASDPTEQQRIDTGRHVRLCEEILFTEEHDDSASTLPPPPKIRTVPPAPPPDQPPRRRTGPDPLGVALLTTGLTAMLASAIQWPIGAGISYSDASRADTEDEYEELARKGLIHTIVGASLLGGGAILTVVGAVRLNARPRRYVTASAWGSPGSGGLSLRGRF